MKKIFTSCLLFIFPLLLIADKALAVPDYYLGDASVYAGSTESVPPNIMFLFDVSQSMTTAGTVLTYNPSFDYIAAYEEITSNPSEYVSGRVYIINSETSGKFNDAKMTINENDTGDYVTCERAREALALYGVWSETGYELKKGACSTTNQNVTYYTGDNASMQYEYSTVAFSSWTTETSYDAGEVIQVTIGDLPFKFTAIQGGASGSDEPDWNLSGDEINDGLPETGVKWKPQESALNVTVNAIKEVALQLGAKVKMGVAAMADNANKGGTIYQELIVPNSEANLQTFNYGIDSLRDEASVSGNHQAVNEGLWDVGAYYNEKPSDFISVNNLNSYPTPITYWCQSNHVVTITTNLTERYVNTRNAGVQDEDGDGVEGSTLDVAIHLATKLDPIEIDGVEYPRKVRTHVVHLFAPTPDYSNPPELLKVAQYGNGAYVPLQNPEQLRAELTKLLLSFLEANSSFLAPVVPASPENRAYSGKRIYLGFFKPMNDRPWYGNLKKFGLNYQNEITGFTGSINAPVEVVATDVSGTFLEDTTCDENDPMPTIFSFWPSASDCNVLYPDGCSACSTCSHCDGGRVELGGTGSKLISGVANREIYTYYNGSFDVITNLDLEPALSLAEDSLITAEELIHFVRGYEADGVTVREWVHGDVMHSKPVVLNYRKFNINDPDEEATACIEGVANECNKGYVFVGANDGMLHAYRDATGEEAWAFIPPDLLPNLQYLTDTERHYYFVDNSPVVYVFDKNGDGEIDPANDKAILIFGLRRGAGSSTITTAAQGSYYALDVTDPEVPEYLWSVTKEDADFPKLGQTWSVPHLTRMKVGDENGYNAKIVAIVGAGYDNAEDLRHGANRKFPDAILTTATVTSSASTGEGSVTSGGEAELTNVDALPHGQGVYVIEVAELTNTGIDTDGGGSYVWGSSSATMYSMPSDPLIIDRNRDGYTDLIYIGDTDGQIYRFIQDYTSLAWTTTKVFKSNSANEGRKVFYKPTATINGSDVLLYFGTGDREHPLNTAVTDRFYVVRDRLSMVGEDPSPWPLDEDDLVDVTDNDLQSVDFNPEYDAYDNPNADQQLLNSLTYSGVNDTVYNGWYINLENAGEKVLAVPKVLSGIVFFSTYQPADTLAPDPCVGNLGPSRLYAVRAMTGEAVYNLDTTNDSDSVTNERATDADGNILGKTDRAINVGDGIASEPLVMINAQGEVSIMVGRGGGFFNVDVETIDPVFPVYWMKW